MNAKPAADDDPRIGFTNQLQRHSVLRIGTHPLPDDRSAAAVGDEPSGAGDHGAIGERVFGLLRGNVLRLDRGQDAECDQIPVGGVVRDVAGGEEHGLRERAAHPLHVSGRPRQHEGPRDALAIGPGGRQQRILPRRVDVAVVPGHVFLDHRAGCWVGRHVSDRPRTHQPNLTAVAQRLSVFGSGAHRHAPVLRGPGGTILGRRGASGAAGMAPTSISGIGIAIAASTALASSL